MIILIALLAAYLPVLAWAWFFYGQDRYHPLPRRLVVTLFLLGLGATAPTGWLNQYLGETLGVEAGGWILVYLVSATLEESMKLGFASARVLGEPAFVEVIDGMIAMITVGLGFAAAENTQYIFAQLPRMSTVTFDLGELGASLLAIAPQRGVISTLGHVAWSGIVGYALGGVVVRGWPRTRLVAALVVAAVFHAGFNILASTDHPLPGADPAVARFAALGMWGVALGVVVTLLLRALGDSPYRTYQLRGRLTGLPALAGLPADRLERAAAHLIPEHVAAGAQVARQGGRAERFLIVVEGRFRVTQTPGPGAAARTLAPLVAGDVFGQVALLTGRATTADLVAETDGMLLTLDRVAFEELVGDDEQVRQNLLDIARGHATSSLVGAALRHYSQSIRVLGPGAGPGATS